MKESTFRYLLT